MFRKIVLTAAALCVGAITACSDGTAGASKVARAKVKAAATGACAKNETPLATSGLCQREAAALLLNGDALQPGAMDGCAWVIRETPFATDLLLYRTLRCGKQETTVEFSVGNHESQLLYTHRALGNADAATDADGQPLVLAQVFAGDPDGRSRALFETRDSMDDKKAAALCKVRPLYQSDGMPSDAVIVDVARSQADLERDDAVPECGPFGYNPAGGSVDFWRTHQGYAWFFHMGTDVWDVDPGSFTIITKDAKGAWTRASDPS